MPPFRQTVQSWAKSLRPGMPRPTTALMSRSRSLVTGPLDLVFMAEGASNVECAWEIPAYDRVFRQPGELRSADSL